MLRLIERFRERGPGPALFWHDQPWTYKQLAHRCATWVERLSAAGISAGDVCAVIGDQQAEACAAMLALLAINAIVVPICSLPAVRYDKCLDAASARFIIEGDAICRRDGRSTRPLIDRLRALNSPGLVLFTSGSTGAPKAILWNARLLIDKHRDANPAYRTLAFLRLDHIGGLNTLFHALGAGGTLAVPSRLDPVAVCGAIERHRVELLPTTPTFLRMMLIARAPERFDLSSLKLITYGTEPMSAGTLRDLCAALPDVRFKQTYGSSELGILPTRSAASDSLWLKLGAETRVVDGVLWVRAPAAMMGYLTHDSPFCADGWFNTHDAVEVEGEHVRILGRASEIINVGGEKVYPAEVEDVLLRAGNVREACVAGRRNAVTGQVVTARVVLAKPEDPASVERRLLAFCRGRLAPYQVPMLIEIAAGPLHGARGKLLRSSAGGADG